MGAVPTVWGPLWPAATVSDEQRDGVAPLLTQPLMALERFTFHIEPVSYTHLDVYKRQVEYLLLTTAAPSVTNPKTVAQRAVSMASTTTRAWPPPPITTTRLMVRAMRLIQQNSQVFLGRCTRFSPGETAHQKYGCAAQLQRCRNRRNVRTPADEWGLLGEVGMSGQNIRQIPGCLLYTSRCV